MTGHRQSPRPPVAAALIKTLIVIGAVLSAALAFVDVRFPVQFDSAILAHTTGFLAGYVVTVMVVLMSRAPLLERSIGADRLARWHGVGGRAFIVLLVIHAVAAVHSWMLSHWEDAFTASLAVLGMPGLVAATAGTVLFGVIAVMSVRAARRSVSYETWHGIHLLSYIALALSFTHELAGPDLAGRPGLQIAWTLFFVSALGLVLRYRVLKPLEHAWRHRLRIERLVPEADGVVSVILRGRHIDELRVEAGQFFRWRFLAPGVWRSAHPFSLSAPPGDDLLRITVKALGNGSHTLHSLRPGTRVLAEGPYGAMTHRKRTRESVLLIAGGVGITPMRALFEELEVGDGSLTLLYRASRDDDVIFRDELEEIARLRGASIVWMIGPSTDPRDSMTGANLTRLVPDVAARDVYVCASRGLSRAVRSALKDAGHPPARLHEEVFAF
ncbi:MULTISPECIES: ferredoxin reductase family protein [unclassified Cryobacterium]|uniref:ferredoxin reductase family protein n=1 Tax=unclassified Cryobacterium TaxID=2649013 RepID=UPI002AB43D39|nr:MULTISPECIES: ferredoxin reductase family protein [unclassified Cryobacterium]MDY7529644.1 ferredoxin reductase family protein [Cryobacterium sp. 10C2]MDY7558217.1 ferredoxin reductase family protein [Cryobacterium sp. 10C3]MEB0202140.1 ferredoxin reductase family protein [Cryobacterium sp. 5I3]MEB0291284.1 ferredoxin reductase family protein [Cryobacterium sp. 10C2]